MFHVLVKFKGNPVPELFGTMHTSHAARLATMTDVEWASPTISNGAALGEPEDTMFPGEKRIPPHRPPAAADLPLPERTVTIGTLIELARALTGPAEDGADGEYVRGLTELIGDAAGLPAEERDDVLTALGLLPAETRDLADLAAKTLTTEDLDDAVHDAASAAASTANNTGIAAQVRFLAAHLGGHATEKLIRDAKPRGNPRSVT